MRHLVPRSTLIILSVLLCACTPGQRPFLMVQICLGDASNLVEFSTLLRSIAQAEHMKFADGSAETKRGLKQIDALRQPDPVIHIAIERKSDGIGLSASNIGLPGYQVVIGFPVAKDTMKAQAFADQVVEKLATRWRVEKVPDGEGAHSLKSCAAKS